ncbi:unnamed protein product [Protopolystoma xenopodis]|uniref:Uncharacterized protein n=1 Tax=Protopolystoma xenopodis TaxID=117903 RepID=A0A448WSP0_9PLAT|nr:unnamed protein product [Protopolystoma xenopodis]
MIAFSRRWSNEHRFRTSSGGAAALRTQPHEAAISCVDIATNALGGWVSIVMVVVVLFFYLKLNQPRRQSIRPDDSQFWILAKNRHRLPVGEAGDCSRHQEESQSTLHHHGQQIEEK